MASCAAIASFRAVYAANYLLEHPGARTISFGKVGQARLELAEGIFSFLNAHISPGEISAREAALEKAMKMMDNK